MADYYKLTTGKHSRCHPLNITNANNPRSLTWEFQIGNGEHRPNAFAIETAFKAFETSERHGKVVIQIPASEAHRIRACIYTDIRGSLWFIENPFHPIIIPEICTHFLINNIFSNVMRYRPDELGQCLIE